MQDQEEYGRRKHIVPKDTDGTYPPRNNRLREQIEWIKRQLDYANFARDYKIRMDVKRGEIYEIDWGCNINAEFSNRHYGLVLKDSNMYDPLVLVCPLKTNHKGAHRLSDVDLGIIEALKSDHETIAVINQVRTVDKMRLYTGGIISGTNLYDQEIPRLDEEKLKRVLTAYFVYLFSDSGLDL